METIILALVLFVVYVSIIGFLIGNSKLRQNEHQTFMTAIKDMFDEIEESNLVDRTNNIESKQEYLYQSLGKAHIEIDKLTSFCDELNEREINKLTESDFNQIQEINDVERDETQNYQLIETNKLTLKEAQKIAKELNIKQSVNGKKQKKDWLIRQIKQKLADKPELESKVFRVLAA